MTDPASDHSGVVRFPLDPASRRLVARALEGDALRKMLDELNRESPHAARPYYRSHAPTAWRTRRSRGWPDLALRTKVME